MKKILMLSSVIFLLLLAACGDIDEKNTREVKSDTEVSSDIQNEPEVEQEEVEEKEKPVGTRSNPLPFGRVTGCV